MFKYLLKRLASGAITVWFIATATFWAMHSVPGDPLLNDKAVDPEIRKNLEESYGLDKPLWHQYGLFLGNMLQGDFGYSYTQRNRKVNDIIRDHFPVSALLGVIALLIAVSGGVVFGAITAVYKDRMPDHIIMVIVILTVSIPNFVFAALSQLGVLNLNEWLGNTFLPVAGWGSWQHIVLPAWVLGLGTLAYLTRLMRSSLLEEEGRGYTLTAHAKGLSRFRILYKHQLKNAILPVITVIGPTIAAITTGGFVVELVFSIPGLGRYYVQAVQQLDYTVIMGTTVFYGAFLVIMVVLVDIVYGFIDPRIRVGQ
ncbi:MAG: ABC transporter permease [Pseudomonadales bacterium]|nr:ABC transporter permease [Pseudomonadales bacterium]